MRQQVLKDGREQGFHLRFWNISDPVLKKDPTAANQIESLGEVDFVVVGAERKAVVQL